MRCSRVSLVVGALSIAPSPIFAQIGEVQLGAVATYGTSKAWGPGAGLVVGVATGRLAYVGLRWTYYAGATTLSVTDRGQAFTVDLGVEIPVGQLEMFLGLSLGAMRFAQSSAGVWSHKTEFLAAPGLAAEAHLARVALMPEVQYSFAGDPAFAQPVRNHGLVASLRLIIPIEVGRIRR